MNQLGIGTDKSVMYRQTVLHFNNLLALHKRLEIGNCLIKHIVLPVIYPFAREEALVICNKMCIDSFDDYGLRHIENSSEAHHFSAFALKHSLYCGGTDLLGFVNIGTGTYV